MKQKGLRKLVSMILAVVMVLAMSITAMADDTYTITITNATNGYTYVVYQIFTGDVETETTEDDDGNETTITTNKLSNVKWGSALDSNDEKLALLKEYEITGSEETVADLAAELAEAIAVATDKDAQTLATILMDKEKYYLKPYGGSTESATLIYSGGEYSLTVEAGYYLIVNTAVPADNKDTENVDESLGTVYSNYIVQVVGDVEMSPKSTSTPTGDKTVDDVNDSNSNGDIEIGYTADYDIGDDVPFTLTATLPSVEEFSDYETYKIVFHDTLSDGLSFNNDVKVYLGTVEEDDEIKNTDDDKYYSVETEELADGCTFEVVIDNVNLIESVEANSKIIVTYTAKLLDSASYSETNTMYLEYSNNPNNSEETGKTPDNVTTVFTFTLSVTKTDEKGDGLEGAGFTLYKKNKDGDYKEVGSEVVTGYQEAGNIDAFESGVTYYTYDNSKDEYTKVTDTTETPDNETDYYVYVDVTSEFTWSGLDDGDYKLVETTTPNGYNTMDDFCFTIKAKHKVNTNGEASVTELKITDEGGNELKDNDGKLIFTTSTADGTISTTIVNEEGSTLPSTGGIGTTIFYIIGGVLVISAAVLLVTRKRLGDAE